MLQGKKVVIFGLASNRSIAHGVAESMHQQGAELAFSYQNERLKERVEKMAASFGSKLVFPCDVSSDDQIESAMQTLKDAWGHIDVLVHSVAFAPSDQLEGGFLDAVSREGFGIAHDISSYSFAALVKSARKAELLTQGSSCITMTYLGANKAMPCYNTMGLAKASLEACVRYMANHVGPEGIRINAISAGPIRTLAASGIKQFRDMLAYNEKVAPLRANVTTEQVGNAATFLSSDMASGITGEILHVDAGFNIVGMAEQV